MARNHDPRKQAGQPIVRPIRTRAERTQEITRATGFEPDTMQRAHWMIYILCHLLPV